MFVILIIQDSPASITGHFRRPPVKTLTDHLANYASYHRDRRNVATHFVGIPLIVLGLMVLLSRPTFNLAGLPLSPAIVVTVLALAYYFALDLFFALVMTVLFALALWLGAWSATLPIPIWSAIGVGGFFMGWVIQFIGHIYEGRKPAFFDDIASLLIGPLFVVAEAMFLLGLLGGLRSDIEQRAGSLRA